MTQANEAEEPSIEELEQELIRVKSELEEYQGLIEDLPSIYEGKFHHQVRGVAQDIRRLLDERRSLLVQIDHALNGNRQQEPLPAGPATEPVVGTRPLAPAFQVPPLSLRTRLILLSAVTAGAVALLVAALGVWHRLRPPQIAMPARPAAPAQPSTPTTPPPVKSAPAKPVPATPAAALAGRLRLRAQGECWVEARTLDGRRVFMDTLRPGEERSLALGDGLRLLAGRPDLLEVAIGAAPYDTLGSIERIEWITLRPSAQPEAPS